MKNKGRRAYQKKTQKDYSLAFKMQLVDEVEKGLFTYQEAQKHYGIQGTSTVLVWLRKHGRLDWLASTDMKKREAPNKKIKELERKLKRLEMEKEILNEAIDVSDEMFGTEIRKKCLPLSQAAFKERAQKEEEKSSQ